MKKALSFILAAVMLITALPLTASAETAAITMTPAITDAVYDYLDEIYIGKYPELGLDFSFGSDDDKEVLQTLADKITKSCSTDEEKAMAVAGWADRNIRYRSYTANNGTYYFPIDVFYYREGNCLGLGLFISQVLRLAGVPAVFCAGTRGDMQDYVKLENRELTTVGLWFTTTARGIFLTLCLTYSEQTTENSFHTGILPILWRVYLRTMRE